MGVQGADVRVLVQIEGGGMSDLYAVVYTDCICDHGRGIHVLNSTGVYTRCQWPGCGCFVFTPGVRKRCCEVCGAPLSPYEWKRKQERRREAGGG